MSQQELILHLNFDDESALGNLTVKSQNSQNPHANIPLHEKLEKVWVLASAGHPNLKLKHLFVWGDPSKLYNKAFAAEITAVRQKYVDLAFTMYGLTVRQLSNVFDTIIDYEKNMIVWRPKRTYRHSLEM